MSSAFVENHVNTVTRTHNVCIISQKYITKTKWFLRLLKTMSKQTRGHTSFKFGGENLLPTHNVCQVRQKHMVFRNRVFKKLVLWGEPP